MIKSNKPKVSVILTSYNHGKYIRHAIESVLNQTFSDIELIIWDDASSDNSWEIINSYSDPRIKIFRNEENLRGNISRGLVISRGKYIAIHHSDDAWEPTKLEKQVAFLDENPDIAAVFTHVYVIDEESQPITDESHFYYKIFEQPNRTRHEWLNHFFYHGNALCHPSVLIRKECYNDVFYRLGLAQIPDLDLWVQLCFKHDIHIIQEKLTYFRVWDNESQISGNRPEVRIRIHYELIHVLKHYKSIASIDDLLMIFPGSNRFINKNFVDILYALGRLAIDTGPYPATKLFGLNLLFEALNDPIRADKLRKYQLFDQKSYIDLTAKNDIFSIEIVNQLKMHVNYQDKVIHGLQIDINERDQSIKERDQSIKERDQLINDQNQQIQEKDQEILFYVLSKSWQITRPLRKIMKLFKGK